MLLRVVKPTLLAFPFQYIRSQPIPDGRNREVGILRSSNAFCSCFKVHSSKLNPRLHGFWVANAINAQVEEVSASAWSLEEMALVMKELVSCFKLGSNQNASNPLPASPNKAQAAYAPARLETKAGVLMNKWLILYNNFIGAS
jgi:hypothetical protein